MIIILAAFLVLAVYLWYMGAKKRMPFPNKKKTGYGSNKERKRHWLKAFVSIAVTLVAMPLTHILARALKDGTAGVEQFYAGMGMGLFGLLMVIIGVFIKATSNKRCWVCSAVCFTGWAPSTSCLCTMPTVSARRRSSTR